MELFILNVSLALQFKLTDQAVDVALRSFEFRQNKDSYGNIIRAYGAKGDLAKQ
ncbi:hypothetical protein D3C72_1673600 [compost metagenome]